ncbi:DKNYY domain-containing protein [Pseudomonas sp. RIT-PI-AD]|uniref:DKNYY domain-containing protein n=1 Tax=Pseudomonas sp. RIT-PI-AD TaxID=3035294 RepID=UPI0021DA7220|nr:DKNYY domain-containing protein [Pseudomonas sp. RIT-PI-AD]
MQPAFIARPTDSPSRLVRKFGATALLVLAAGLGGCSGTLLDETVSANYYRTPFGDIAYIPGGNAFERGRTLIEGADAASFRPLSQRYARDRQRVYYTWRPIEADPASFTVLAEDFARDDRHLFRYGYRIDHLDPATTRRVGRHYLADARAAWYGEFEGEDGPVIRRLLGADPASLNMVGDEPYFAADARGLFFMQYRLPLTRATDLEVLDENSGPLVFRNGGDLHSLGIAREGADPLEKYFKVSRTAIDSLVLTTYHGLTGLRSNPYWALLNGHLLAYKHDGRYVPVRDQVKALRFFERSIYYVQADRELYYFSPHQPDRALNLGQVADDLAILDPGYAINAGRVLFEGRPLPEADSKRFTLLPGERYDRVDARDDRFLYHRGETVAPFSEETLRQYQHD